MIIDRGHLRWGLGSTAVFLAGGALYALYASRAPSGPSGGSWPGLAFGIAGFAMMIFATLLSFRRKVRTWRLGRATTWLKGHIWLGLLSVPMILFHGGFAAGGPLTAVLLGLLFAVTGSGVILIVLQQVLPRTITQTVPLETIYDEIPHVCEQLRDEADTLVGAVCGDLGLPPRGESAGSDGVAAAAARTDRARAASSSAAGGTMGPIMAGGGVRPGAAAATKLASLAAMSRVSQAGSQSRTQGGATGGAGPASSLAVSAAGFAEPVPGSEPLRDFYLARLRGFLGPDGAPDPELGRREYARGIFDRLRTLVPPSLSETIDDLAEVCEERRQLRVQARLHHVLHGWLLVHVPLTAALMVLSVVHAVLAIRY